MYEFLIISVFETLLKFSKSSFFLTVKDQIIRINSMSDNLEMYISLPETEINKNYLKIKIISEENILETEMSASLFYDICLIIGIMDEGFEESLNKLIFAKQTA